MTKLKRSPWFSVIEQPPINGGDDAVYEWRCARLDNQVLGRVRKAWLLWKVSCPECQWRGVLREDGE